MSETQSIFRWSEIAGGGRVRLPTCLLAAPRSCFQAGSRGRLPNRSFHEPHLGARTFLSALTLSNAQADKNVGAPAPRQFTIPRHLKNPVLLLTLGFLLLAWSATGAPQFTASLNPDTIRPGETATLSLVFENGSPGNSLEIPDIPGLKIQSAGQSETANFSWGNSGKVSLSQYTYNFAVTSLKPGEYSIPAMSVKVGKTTLTSPPLKLKVLRPNEANTASANPVAQYAFVKLALPKLKVYIGELFTLEIQVYAVNGQLRNVSRLPADGFTIVKGVPGDERPAQIGNRAFKLIPVQVTLVPNRTGKLELGPVQCDYLLEVRGWGGFFPQAQPVQLVSDPITIEVLPLPSQNVPPAFRGAVGDYKMTVQASPTNVAVGDPITLKVQVAGRGHLDSLVSPISTNWHDFKLYPPSSKVESTDPLGREGVKTFEQVVTPLNAGVAVIPPIVFTFLDPATGQYRTLTQAAIPLYVKPAAGPQAQPTILAQTGSDVSPPTRDIVHIKTRLGTLATVPPPWIQQPRFLALQLLPLGLWLGAWGWRKRHDFWERNPRKRRQRQVARLIHHGLPKLRQTAEANKFDDFFVLLFRLLQEQLGERLDLPAPSITEAVIEEQLRPHGVPEEILTQLHELFHACNQARYAPQHTLPMLVALAPRAEAVLRELQQLPDPAPAKGNA